MVSVDFCCAFIPQYDIAREDRTICVGDRECGVISTTLANALAVFAYLSMLYTYCNIYVPSTSVTILQSNCHQTLILYVRLYESNQKPFRCPPTGSRFSISLMCLLLLGYKSRCFSGKLQVFTAHQKGIFLLQTMAAAKRSDRACTHRKHPALVSTCAALGACCCEWESVRAPKSSTRRVIRANARATAITSVRKTAPSSTGARPLANKSCAAATSATRGWGSRSLCTVRCVSRRRRSRNASKVHISRRPKCVP